ncbi:hypothetical protein HY968_02780 [Candidatus Kaiserbacteria bacterium]|nr:hypothetical protein [Candidatus Kaiserbacteria bacterium]
MPGQENQHEKERIDRLRQAMYSRQLSEKLKPRERRDLSETKPIVGDDWVRQEPEMAGAVVAPLGVSWLRRALYWILGVALVFFFGAGGFFLYYFTIGGGSLPASPQNIDIVVSGPSQVAGGEPTELQVAVTNRNKVALELADIVVTYPQGTRSVNDYATELPSLRQSLGTIEAGGRRQGTVSAVFAGADSGHGDVKVELEYRVAGSNSIYVASTHYTLNYSTAPISISVEGNSETIAGQAVQMTVTVTSNANAPIKDLLMQADYPFGFKFSSSVPTPATGSFWELGDLNPGQKKTIVVNGSLIGDAGDQRVFHFTAGTRPSTDQKSLVTRMADTVFTSAVSRAFLKLGITVNGGDSSVVVSPGDKVEVTLSYQNNLDTAVNNAVIVAKLSGIEIDGTKVRSTTGFFRSADDSIFWDKTTTNGVLATLAPGGKGTLSFSLQMPGSESLAAASNPRLNISVNAAGNRLSESGVPQVLQSTAHSTISLASDLQLIAEGLYYTNPFGSSGPIPPKAGEETTYALVFTVRNTTNKITGATLTATLPPYVRWVGIYSPASETVTFNQLDSTVTWHLGDIAPGVGLDALAPRQAAIAIGFTPSTSQIGQQPVLLSNIILKGFDDSSGKAIERDVDDVTSNLAKVSASSPDIVTAGDQGFSAANATVVK